MLSSNNLVAIAAAIAAVTTTVWGALRREKRADFDQAVYEQMVRALAAAKVKAIHDGKPDPWPHLAVPGFPCRCEDGNKAEKPTAS